jgi:hypothetical protein
MRLHKQMKTGDTVRAVIAQVEVVEHIQYSGSDMKFQTPCGRTLAVLQLWSAGLRQFLQKTQSKHEASTLDLQACCLVCTHNIRCRLQAIIIPSPSLVLASSVNPQQQHDTEAAQSAVFWRSEPCQVVPGGRCMLRAVTFCQVQPKSGGHYIPGV